MQHINNFSGGELPYTYLWSYTGENVTLVSNLTDSELKFKVMQKIIYKISQSQIIFA